MLAKAATVTFTHPLCQHVIYIHMILCLTATMEESCSFLFSILFLALKEGFFWFSCFQVMAVYAAVVSLLWCWKIQWSFPMSWKLTPLNKLWHCCRIEHCTNIKSQVVKQHVKPRKCPWFITKRLKADCQTVEDGPVFYCIQIYIYIYILGNLIQGKDERR